MKYIPEICRILLTILLLVGAYHETGTWTTIALTLLFISSEASAWIFKMQREIRQ